MRLDVFLTEKGFTVSRAKAQEMIRTGAVTVNGKTEEKPSFAVQEGDEVFLAENPLQRYVGRGGLKLEAALKHFGLSPKGKVAVDIGASSGGFTDCLLQNGAAFVYAVDTGVGQLHPSLKEDARVQSMENFNARYMKKEDFPKRPSFAVMDVSFISQTLILPAVVDVLDSTGMLITLIKPQFELDKGALDKRGIVKNSALRAKAVEKVVSFAASLGFVPLGTMQSAILGGDGNIEYLAAFSIQKQEASECKKSY